MKQFLDKYMGGLFGYLIVGGLATIVEWAGFWLFSEKLSIEYLLATALAFAISTFANWLFGRLLVFRGKQQSLLRGAWCASARGGGCCSICSLCSCWCSFWVWKK